MKILSKDKPITIVCFGDSNTRYFLGDTQEDGCAADSYPAKLQELFWEHDFQGVRVLNCGMPDAQTDYALANFMRDVVDNQADVMIYGFGTNCIRQDAPDLEGYLEDTARVFDLCKQRGIQPVSLLLPWFAEGYCGKEGQMRLPGWNSALCELCMIRGVPILDTYNTFSGDPDRFFSETATPKRHYSAAATQVIAEMAFAMISACIR